METKTEREAIERDFAHVQAWSRLNHRPIYLGEFGAYERGNMDSRVRWTAFIARQAEKQGWSWTYWPVDHATLLRHLAPLRADRVWLPEGSIPTNVTDLRVHRVMADGGRGAVVEFRQ